MEATVHKIEKHMAQLTVQKGLTAAKIKFPKIPDAVKRQIWTWFENNKELKLFKIRPFKLFTLKVKVKHAKPLFTLFFGKPPLI